MGQMRVRRTGPWVKIPCPFSWVQFIRRVGQRVSLEETPKIKHLKKLRIAKENHRNQVIPVIFGGERLSKSEFLISESLIVFVLFL